MPDVNNAKRRPGRPSLDTTWLRALVDTRPWPDECAEWPGVRNGDGYGIAGRFGKAHRVAYELAFEADVQEIRRRYAAGETQTALGPIFGIDQTTVSMIVRRKQWAHIA